MKPLISDILPLTPGGARPYGARTGECLGLEVGDLAKPELHDQIIQVYDFEAGKAFNASGDTDHFLYNCHWSADGSGIYYVAYHLLNAQLFRLDLKKREARHSPIFPKSRSIRSPLPPMADDRFFGEHAGLAAGNLCRGYQLARQGPAPDRPSPRTGQIWLGETEESPGSPKNSLEIQGNIVYPRGYVKGQAYPTLTLIHGGPAGNFNSSLAALYYCPAQYFAGQGYLVYMPEVRGSIGWGSEFMRKNLRDWGGGDYRDLMAGLDILIARGLADKTASWSGVGATAVS